MIDLVPQFAADNGLRDRIIARKGLSSDVQIPEKADVMIASMLDAFGIDNNLLAIVVDARERLLKPGGAIIPQAVQLSYCPVELPEWYKANIDCWNTPHLGFSFRAARARAANQAGSGKITKESLLAAPESFDEIILTAANVAKVAARGSFRIERPGVLHALAGWFRATMAEGIFCSNSPLDPTPLPWNLALLPIHRPAAVAAGDRVDIAIRADTLRQSMIWSWDVWLYGPDGTPRAEFHQSTFFGLFLEGLRKYGSGSVPSLSERGRAELAVLELCDGKRSMGEIAETILRGFPQMFETEPAAQTFAALLLQGTD
jgi:protein arginine N-methyltransferase 1